MTERTETSKNKTTTTKKAIDLEFVPPLSQLQMFTWCSSQFGFYFLLHCCSLKGEGVGGILVFVCHRTLQFLGKRLSFWFDGDEFISLFWAPPPCSPSVKCERTGTATPVQLVTSPAQSRCIVGSCISESTGKSQPEGKTERFVRTAGFLKGNNKPVTKIASMWPSANYRLF